jgi:uncharacterized tellurite resistance protein B-like protein
VEVAPLAIGVFDILGIPLRLRRISIAKVAPFTGDHLSFAAFHLSLEKNHSMDSEKNYQLGLLYLVHLLINADGIVNEHEQQALMKIIEKEKISPTTYEEFLQDVSIKKPKQIYLQGIALINGCADQKKLNAFVHLFKLSEVDGSVHVKEVRLLLYSIKMADIEFNDVIDAASKWKDY